MERSNRRIFSRPSKALGKAVRKSRAQWDLETMSPFHFHNQRVVIRKNTVDSACFVGLCCTAIWGFGPT